MTGVTSAILKPGEPILQRGNPLAVGMIGAWAVRVGSGSSLYSSADGVNQLTGTTSAIAWAGGPDGNSLSFTAASSSSVSFPVAASNTAYGFTNAKGTVFVRAKYVSNASTGFIVSTEDAAGGGWALAFLAAASVNIGTKDGAGNNSIAGTSADTFNDGLFHDIVLTLTTSTTVAANNVASVWVDGKLEVNAAVGALTYGAPTNGLLFGARTNAGTPEFFLNGNIACVFMWNRILSLNEILALSFDPYIMLRDLQTGALAVFLMPQILL